MQGPSPVATGTKELVIFRDAVSTVSAIAASYPSCSGVNPKEIYTY